LDPVDRINDVTGIVSEQSFHPAAGPSTWVVCHRLDPASWVADHHLDQNVAATFSVHGQSAAATLSVHELP